MRKLTIVTLDQIIIVDDCCIDFKQFGGFEMVRGEWAVQFNGAFGEIEYTDSRPNKSINQSEIQNHYMWAYELFDETLAEIKAREEAERLAAEEAAKEEAENNETGEEIPNE